MKLIKTFRVEQLDHGWLVVTFDVAPDRSYTKKHESAACQDLDGVRAAFTAWSEELEAEGSHQEDE